MKKIIYRITGLYLNTLFLISPKIAAIQAFKLFCYPQRPKLKERHKEFLNNGKSSVFTIHNNKIQVYKWGKGSKNILLLHGWQSHTFRWKNYIEALLNEDVTIFAFDAPGHGYSGGDMLHLPLYSQTIEKFLEEQGSLETIVGHSLGGFALAYTLYRKPSIQLKKIILMGCPGEAMDFILYYKDLLQLNDQLFHHLLEFFNKTIGHSIDFFSMAAFAPALKLSGQIIHELYDKEAPYIYAKRLNEHWKNSVLITTEGLNHNLKSEQVVQEVKKFILEEVNVEELAKNKVIK